jgi:hypothetical protein
MDEAITDQKILALVTERDYYYAQAVNSAKSSGGKTDIEILSNLVKSEKCDSALRETGYEKYPDPVMEKILSLITAANNAYNSNSVATNSRDAAIALLHEDFYTKKAAGAKSIRDENYNAAVEATKAGYPDQVIAHYLITAAGAEIERSAANYKEPLELTGKENLLKATILKMVGTEVGKGEPKKEDVDAAVELLKKEVAKTPEQAMSLSPTDLKIALATAKDLDLRVA